MVTVISLQSQINASLRVGTRRLRGLRLSIFRRTSLAFVGADEGIGPYKVQRKIEGCGRTESSAPTNAAKDVWEIHCGGE